jgi:hypothetical protein
MPYCAFPQGARVNQGHRVARKPSVRRGRSVFFDEYPLFYETSQTAAEATRLNLRHQAMI